MVVFILSGCGISDEEKNNIAERACKVAEATRRFESARRVELINDAREKLGMGPYPGSSDRLDFMISSGSCEELITNSEEFWAKEEAEALAAVLAAFEALEKEEAAARAAKEKEEAAARAAELKAAYEPWLSPAEMGR